MKYNFMEHRPILHRRTEHLTKYQITSMENSRSWEANRFSASHVIPHILWKPKFHYRIQKCQPPVPTPSQLDPAHTPVPYFLKIHLIIILSSMLGSCNWSPSLSYPHQNLLCFSSSPYSAICPVQNTFFLA